MVINVTGPGPLRTSVTAQTFGTHSFPGGSGRWVGYQQAQLVADPDRSPTLLSDEDVEIRASVRAARLAAVTLVVEATADGEHWSEVSTAEGQNRRLGDRLRLTVRTRLPAGTASIRVKTTVRAGRRSTTHVGTRYAAKVLPAPAVLTFIAMGGSGSGGSSGTGSGSSGSSGGSGSSSGDGIEVKPGCQRDPRLIEELLLPGNIACNDLCAGCLNFVEALGLRVLNDENLADDLSSLRHKEDADEPDYCAQRSNPRGIRHRIVLGKWENSEHEHFRPPPIKTFESILDEYLAAGGGALIVVANSLAGAKLAATVGEYWRWGALVRMVLFVAWDATHLGGGVASIGPRPRRVVNFFQQGNVLWFQNGHRIAEANREFELTDCFSHNAVPRSVFVHDTTYTEIRSELARLRDDARSS